MDHLEAGARGPEVLLGRLDLVAPSAERGQAGPAEPLLAGIPHLAEELEGPLERGPFLRESALLLMEHPEIPKDDALSPPIAHLAEDGQGSLEAGARLGQLTPLLVRHPHVSEEHPLVARVAHLAEDGQGLLVAGARLG